MKLINYRLLSFFSENDKNKVVHGTQVFCFIKGWVVGINNQQNRVIFDA